MNIFDSVMESVNPINEGFLDMFKNKKKPEGFVSVEIESPLGTLKTINKRSGDRNLYTLQTTKPISFSIFGKKYEHLLELTNCGTENALDYSSDEIKAIQNAIKLITSKKNTIKKELYSYLLDLEEEYFEDYDYDRKKNLSKTCRSLMNDAACKDFYSDISLEVSTYDGVAIAYLNISNEDVLGEGIVCTIVPEIRVDGWESMIFEDIADEYK